MSAPLSAYHSKALKDKTTPQNYLQCKFLSEYTDIGSHFYLDYILKFKDAGVFYFTGACVVGSAKSKYHAAARKQKLFDVLEVYTDGGLNTLGDCSIGDNILRHSNIVLQNNTFKSAYYLFSSNFGLKYKINSGSWITAVNANLDGGVATTLEAKTTYTDPLAIIPVANKDDMMTIKTYITNSEGVMESNTQTFTLLGAIYEYDAIFRTSPQESSGETSISFYMIEEDYVSLSTLTDTGAATGIYGYTTIFRTTPIASGWYVGILEDKALYVDSTGQFTNYTELVPLQWEVQCAVGMTQPTPESNFFHNSAMFELNFNAPSDVLLNGRISKTPADQPADNVITFSATILQGTTIIETETGQGYEYLPDTNYYLIVTAPNHPQITFFGDGQFLP
jgi:hypothetical protein